MSNAEKATDKDLFVLQSESGDQWFVCNLLEKNEKKAKDRQFNYEIVKICTSEDKALKTLENMHFFKSSNKNIKVVRKPKKRGSYKLPKEERIPRTLEEIL